MTQIARLIPASSRPQAMEEKMQASLRLAERARADGARGFPPGSTGLNVNV